MMLSRYRVAATRLVGLRRCFSVQPAAAASTANVPTIDLDALQQLKPGEAPPAALVEEVASACAEWGFFQVINHGVDRELCMRAEEQQRQFFALPAASKEPIRRSAANARGWYNDELTKQRRDWKEGLDFGSTPSMDWALRDEDAANGNLDGYNRFPPADVLPQFRPVMLEYFDALTGLAERLTRLFALGLDVPADYFEPVLKHGAHTSYLRLNYYPPCPDPGPPPAQLGISPHKDAGFLTVLAQDPSCHSLQVRDRSRPDEWVTVRPIEGAFTINTGDMAQVWSNDRYFAPEHRVLTHPTKERYSAPFFYNPAYHAAVKPLPTLGPPRFDELVWGYFRAIRFAGDFADYGTEIQIDDFRTGSDSWHVANQSRFMAAADFERSFDIEANRRLLTRAAGFLID